MNPRHLVTGAGPVGSNIALQLAERGVPVRLVSRSGRGPDEPGIERIAADVTDPTALERLTADVGVIHHCIHGSRYAAATWRRELPMAEHLVMEAADRVGAVVVFPESLYAYGPVTGPMTETTPRAATVGKLAVRVELLAARAAHPAATVSVAASDFYGPRVLTAHAGDRLMPRVLAGRPVSVVGSLDQPHSYTYVPDLAAAMITAAGRQDLWDSLLHAPTAPPVTQRELVAMTAAAAGVAMPKVSAIPVWALRAAGVFASSARELAETGYMFTDPFVMDSQHSQQLLGLHPTPLVDGLARTVAHWRGEPAGKSRGGPPSRRRLGTVTFWELLQRRVRVDGAQPLITCYDADGARTELSATTYANWVAKSANLITWTIDAGTGDRIALPVAARHPGHWMTLVWIGACWTAGVEVVLAHDRDVVAVVSGPELDFGDSTADRFACSLHPLALGFPAELPSDVTDWAVEVKGEGDEFGGVTPMADDLAWGGLTLAEVLDVEPVSARVLFDCRDTLDPLVVARGALIAPLLGGGSSVTVLGGDPSSVAAAERAEPVSPG